MVKKLHISFIRTFIGISSNCNSCLLYEDDNQKRLEYQSRVRKELGDLINNVGCTNNQQEIAEEALRICENCDYKDNYVFHFLEKKDIKVS